MPSQVVSTILFQLSTVYEQGLALKQAYAYLCPEKLIQFP